MLKMLKQSHWFGVKTTKPGALDTVPTCADRCGNGRRLKVPGRSLGSR